MKYTWYGLIDEPEFFTPGQEENHFFICGLGAWFFLIIFSKIWFSLYTQKTAGV